LPIYLISLMELMSAAEMEKVSVQFIFDFYAS
jgi:hypothetical protein